MVDRRETNVMIVDIMPEEHCMQSPPLLEGIKVLDLSQLLPGSLCSQMLADLGADVIKVENPKGGDSFRHARPLVGKDGSFFHIANRNKRSMTVNLKEQAGLEIVQKMIPGMDVLIENFRPGVIGKMGLGYEKLKGINPRIVYCSLTSFGQDGPYRDRPAHDLNVLSLSGILDLLGHREESPIVPVVQIAGVSGSLHAVIGILASLFKRERSGMGQCIDASILDSLSPFLSLVMSQYLTDKILHRRGEPGLGGGAANYNVYRTKDGKYISLGCVEEKFWAGFCRAVNREDLTGDIHAPPARQKEMIAEVRSIFAQRTQREWLEILAGSDTCYAPVNDLEEALDDCQIVHRGLWFKGRHPAEGEVPQQAFPIKFSDYQPGWRSHPPGLGEHTREILKEMDYQEDEILHLAEKGII
jgi:crotonobetainyl-CoA:carnitine CoA-transferase CaiB-like acyl-CoA transferase